MLFTLGVRKMHQLEEALAAKPLTPDQIAQVEAILPRGAVAGTRAIQPRTWQR